MKTFAYILMILVLLLAVPGCSSDKERGMNRPGNKKDMPRKTPSSERDKEPPTK